MKMFTILVLFITGCSTTAPFSHYVYECHMDAEYIGDKIEYLWADSIDDAVQIFINGHPPGTDGYCTQFVGHYQGTLGK